MTPHTPHDFMIWIRQKPEAYRKRFSFFVALAITFIIFLFWIVSLRLYFKEKSMSEAALEAKRGTASSYSTASASDFNTTPLKSLLQDISDGIKSLKP